MKHYLNDSWVNEEDLKISALDIAVLRGFGIFDFLRTYGKKPFRLDEHIDRFFRSAKIMGITPVKSKKEIEDLVNEGIKLNNFDNTQIKIVQTGGVSPDGFTPSTNPNFFILFQKAALYPSEIYNKGIKLITSSLMRQIPQAKTINYAASIAEVQKAQKQGAKDILHTDEKGNIYEATRSNFFAVKDGKLITAQEGILFGITRNAILELAKKMKIPVDFRTVNKSELSTIDEAFISNSSQEIAPVVVIDNTTIGDGKVGPLTKKFINELQRMAIR